MTGKISFITRHVTLREEIKLTKQLAADEYLLGANDEKKHYVIRKPCGTLRYVGYGIVARIRALLY